MTQRYERELVIEQRDPNELLAHPQNYRAHPAEQIEEIAKSLRALGQYRNVVARPDGTLLAGHGVVEAARKVGMKTVAVHIFEGTAEQEHLLMVADNELSRKAVDDEQLLLNLLREMDDVSGTGWTQEEVEEAINGALQPSESSVETVTHSEAEYRWLVAFTVSEQEKLALEAACVEYGGKDEETLREIILARVV